MKAPTMSQRYVAFTLAEVLITLGIIGIVASMTIPTLMNKTNEAEIIAALKKNYSIFSQVAMQAAAANGGSLANACVGNNNNTCFANLFKPYLSITKDCSIDLSKGCWHEINQFYWYNGSPINQDFSASPTLILKDGTLVYIIAGNADCSNTPGTVYKSNLRCGYVYIDVNGFKKPNTIGKDIFEFNFLPNSVVPAGAPQITNDSYIGNVCPITNADESCTYYYLYVKNN